MPTVTASELAKAEYDACTPNEKKKYPRCGHIARNSGRPCRLTKGSGTDHFGEGKCYRHENAKDMRAPLAKIQHDTFSMARPISTNPAKALQFVLDVTFGQLVYAYWKVSLLEEDEYWVSPPGGGVKHLNKHIRHLTSLKDETVRYAKAAGDLGIAERMTAIAEGQAVLISRFVSAVVGDLDLTNEQHEALGPAIRAHTKMLVAQNQDAVVGDVLNADGTLSVRG